MSVFGYKSLRNHRYGGLLLSDIPAPVERFITEDLCRLNVASVTHITNERIIRDCKSRLSSHYVLLKKIFISVTDNYLSGIK